jgi:hypothetical protein
MVVNSLWWCGLPRRSGAGSRRLRGRTGGALNFCSSGTGGQQADDSVTDLGADRGCGGEGALDGGDELLLAHLHAGGEEFGIASVAVASECGDGATRVVDGCAGHRGETLRGEHGNDGHGGEQKLIRWCRYWGPSTSRGTTGTENGPRVLAFDFKY